MIPGKMLNVHVSPSAETDQSLAFPGMISRSLLIRTRPSPNEWVNGAAWQAVSPPSLAFHPLGPGVAAIWTYWLAGGAASAGSGTPNALVSAALGLGAAEGG